LLKNREQRLQLGQFFTKDREVNFMLDLIQNSGPVLEPSCGDGAFLQKLPHSTVGVEMDATVAPKKAIVMDFFDFSAENKFATIIGNPPYVANDKILDSTREKVSQLRTWSGKTNLFVLFIEKSLDHLDTNGELIFIVPSVFLKATSCQELNKKMSSLGTITDLVLYGDTTPFGSDAAPEHETCIFRFEKGNFTRKTKMHLFDKEQNKIIKQSVKNYYVDSRGISWFLKSGIDVSKLMRIGDYFAVKVGAVTGLDNFFVDPTRGNKDFVFSKTRSTGKTRRMIDEASPTSWLEANREKLIDRKIKKQWTEKDWWKWGRPQSNQSGKRIYVNNKTRTTNPFFFHECENYDGSVLAIFPKDDTMDIEKVVGVFNNIDWEMFSVKVGGRYIFKQRVLENCFLTEEQFENCF